VEAWTTLERRTLLSRGHWLTVEEHRVALPDGRTIDDWSWIIAPPYVTVIAVTSDSRVLCFRQYKYAVGGDSLAPIAGYIEPGEEPLDAARRELMEEAGYASDSWKDLGRYVVDSNRGAGVAHLLLARDARRVDVPDADDLEEQELLALSLDEFRTTVTEGGFKALSWIAVAALALLQLPI
jgi:ADP-ribose pyrophosphatase